MGDKCIPVEDRETDKIAKLLSQAIVRSDEYTTYKSILEEIKKQPELYDQVNSLRKMNFMMQNGGGGRMSLEEYQTLSAQSRSLRANPLVNRFLDAEVGLGRLIQDINKNILADVDFDDEFLN